MFPLATYKCEKCGFEDRVCIKNTNVICPRCGSRMHRQWKSIGIGDVVDDGMVKINQMMLNSRSSSNIKTEEQLTS